MVVFHVDLDNTVIFSYKREIGEEKRSVETYQGREISFITEKTYELLKKVSEKVLLVPTTTRTQEQYNRIHLGIGSLPYALVCNGGVLLVNGKKDEQWYSQSKALVSESRQELAKSIKFLEKEPTRELEVRFIEEMFVFTKCSKPQQTVSFLQKELDTTLVDVLNNGVKVYVVPKKLSKGQAVERFREYRKSQKVFAAGDSEFDISMLEASDVAAAPASLTQRFKISEQVCTMPGQAVYSEEVLEYILKML